MAIKNVCDVCGEDATHRRFISDGGTQVDQPSGRTEETGDNFDFCAKCYVDVLAAAVRKVPGAIRVFDQVASAAVKQRWKGGNNA